MYVVYKNTPLTDDKNHLTRDKCIKIDAYLSLYNFLPLTSQLKIVELNKNYDPTGHSILYSKTDKGWEIVE